jgi:hypothetical protein
MVKFKLFITLFMPLFQVYGLGMWETNMELHMC